MRGSKARFTDLQGQYLAFIEAYTTLHGVAPAEADMQRFFRVTPPAVHRMVLALERRGLLTRVAGEARSIRLLLPAVEIPKLARHEGRGPANRVSTRPTRRFSRRAPPRAAASGRDRGRLGGEGGE